MFEHEAKDTQNPRDLNVRSMEQTLFEHGWDHVVRESEYGSVAVFVRKYERVNHVLENHDWREVIGKIPSALDERAPYLPRGLGVGTAGKETSVEIEVHGDLGNWIDVSKVYIIDSILREEGFEDVDQEVLSEWLKLQEEPGAPKRGSKAYYEQDPRSAELRSLCLKAIELYSQVIISEGSGSTSMELLIDLNKRLSDLSVEPGMHVGARSVEFVDPVVRTEWIAGQIRDLLQRGYGFSGSAKAIIEEHNLLSETHFVMIDSESPAASPLDLLMNLDLLAKELDRDAEEQL